MINLPSVISYCLNPTFILKKKIYFDMAKSYSCKLVFFGGSSLLQFSIQKILYLLSATSRSVFSPWEVFLLTQGNSIYFYLSSSRTNSNGFCKPRTIFIPPAERSVTPTTSTLHLSLLPQNLVV